MKLKFILAAVLISGASLIAHADGYKDGVEYYQAGQEKNAEIVLNETLNDPQTDKAEAYYYLGCIALHKGDNATADKYFDQGIQANAEFAYNYVGKGAVALKNNNKDAAEDFFKQAEKINKKDAKVKVDIARAYYDADKVKYNKEWNNALKDAKKKDKKEASIYIFEGDVYADEQKYGDSAGYYEMAIMYDAERPIAYVKYANTYFHISPEVAIQKLEEIVNKNPNSALAQRELAEKYYENNQWTKAAAQYKFVIDNPNHFPSDDERYVVLLYFGEKYTESLAYAQAQLQKNPKSFQMLRMQFLNAAALEKYEDAAKYAADFFALQGQDHLFTSNDYNTYGTVLERIGRLDEAVAAYEKAVAVNPDKIDLLKDLSSAYASIASEEADSVKRADLYYKSAEAYQKFVDKGEYVTNDLYVLAGKYQNIISTAVDTAKRNEAYKKGIEVIDQVIAKVPDDYRIYRRKALINYNMENGNAKTGLALDSYLKVEEIVNNDAEMDAESKKNILNEVYAYVASYYLYNDDAATAKAYYEKMLALNPENEALREYISKMKIN